jgi:hypothetical protein
MARPKELESGTVHNVVLEENEMDKVKIYLERAGISLSSFLRERIREWNEIGTESWKKKKRRPEHWSKMEKI